MTRLAGLLRMLGQALTRDRIRVPRGEGQLLRLRPPCLLTAGTETVRVVSRRVSQTADGPTVSYACQAESGPARLIVRLTPTLRTDATWQQDGRETPIAESDIVVWSGDDG